eukprot:5790901-Pyramimonas_sp.AAC.1
MLLVLRLAQTSSLSSPHPPPPPRSAALALAPRAFVLHEISSRLSAAHIRLKVLGPVTGWLLS